MATSTTVQQRLSHVPLCGGHLPLQLLLVGGVGVGPYWRPSAATEVRDAPSPALDDDVVTIQFVTVNETLDPVARRATLRPRGLVIIALHRFLKGVGRGDRLRLGAVWMPLLLLARTQGLSMRIVYVCLTAHSEATRAGHENVPLGSAWTLLQLVRPSTADDDYPPALSLPAGSHWRAGFLDCRCATSVPLHLVAARYELLLVVTTVVFLRGWPADVRVVLEDVVSGPDATVLRLRTEPRPASGPPDDDAVPSPTVSLHDAAHGLHLEHRLLRPAAVLMVPVTGLAVRYECTGCGRWNHAVEPAPARGAERPRGGSPCPRCGDPWAGALPDRGVLLRVVLRPRVG